MKTLNSTIIALFISLSSFATHQNSNLKVRMFDHRPIVIALDDKHFNNASSSISIQDITPGTHRLTIWAVRGNGHHYGSSDNHRPIFSGLIEIPRKSNVKSMITKNYQYKIISIEQLSYNTIDQPCHSPEIQFCQNVPIPVCNTNQFEQFLSVLQNQNFDQTKLKMAKDYIRNHTIGTRQIVALMNELTFESNKLELAKFAYLYAHDPQNYYLTYNEFSFDSSVNDLIDFIQSRS